MPLVSEGRPKVDEVADRQAVINGAICKISPLFTDFLPCIGWPRRAFFQPRSPPAAGLSVVAEDFASGIIVIREASGGIPPPLYPRKYARAIGGQGADRPATAKRPVCPRPIPGWLDARGERVTQQGVNPSERAGHAHRPGNQARLQGRADPAQALGSAVARGSRHRPRVHLQAFAATTIAAFRSSPPTWTRSAPSRWRGRSRRSACRSRCTSTTRRRLVAFFKSLEEQIDGVLLDGHHRATWTSSSA